jgi:hypothetical protein
MRPDTPALKLRESGSRSLYCVPSGAPTPRTQMTRAIGFLSALAVFATPAVAQHTSPRNATLPVGAARQVEISAGAGLLRVQGATGATEVTVAGEARAHSESLLREIQLLAEVRGDVIHIETLMPSSTSGFRLFNLGGQSPVLNLVITVPAGMAVTASDGSGEAEFRGTGALRVRDGSGSLIVQDVMGEIDIEDGSGEITVRNVTGPLRIRDGSGSIRVEGAGRDLTVRDGSGEIVIRRVGNVHVVADGSGSIDIEDATGSVRVDSDGSGDIIVSRVGGDFTVGRGGSGRIRHENVRGRVELSSR